MDTSVLTHYQARAEEGVQWIVKQLVEDGSLTSKVHDLVAYHKIPYLLHQAGYYKQAQINLSYIAKSFTGRGGDFVTSQQKKTHDKFSAHFPVILNTWVTIAALNMGRFEIAYPAANFLRGFYHPEAGGFITNVPYGQGQHHILDVNTTAHLGLLSLYFGDINKAKRAGNYLTRAISLQPDIQHCFYVRMEEEGKLITAFSDEDAPYSIISSLLPGQRADILGMCIAFLGKLYHATQENSFLSSAKSLIEFVRRSHKEVLTDAVTGSLAWGLAIIAGISKEKRYTDLAYMSADCLAEHLLIRDAERQDPQAHAIYNDITDRVVMLQEIVQELSRV